MYVMTLNFPNLAKGEPVDIDGLGRFENGYEYQVTEEEADQFRRYNARQVASHGKKGNLVMEAEPGPTLLQAFKKNPSVDVRVMTDDELKALEPVDENPEGSGS